ncbi:hypothetical protein K450DRAFT_253511 [Umbelopsis ramanniana AG]|uniref:Uncharacterized protein n=1 Tax=Umbelopsis ramanniana AG TaxID=1314678 RepID=A0AAD5E5J9_UMBRA|nr:uncharacterized protein K450DRAFT_253511 [Umbelopsis ramanniana AG]KAI8577069.1 hypothetical protein K450DRAFT_253511 [Umbelopsis ramanniana AG]
MSPPTILTSQAFNIGLMLFAMQASKKISWEDPETIQLARAAYGIAQLVAVAITYYLIMVVKKKNDTTTLRYVVPGKPSTNGQPSEPTAVVTTHRAYDIDQLQKAIRSIFTTAVMFSVVHFYFKINQPLLLQSIVPIKNALISKEALIHLWGDAAEGPLQRPFKAESPFSALLGMANAPLEDGADKKKEQ